MASFFETYVTGDEQLDRRLKQLVSKTRKKITRSALGKGGTVILKAVKSETSSKRIKKSIGKSTKKVRRRTGIDFQGLRVGANVGKKKKKLKDGTEKDDRSPHAHLVILGTQQRQHKSGKSTGSMPSDDIVKRGFNKSKGLAMAKIRTELRKKMQAENHK